MVTLWIITSLPGSKSLSCMNVCLLPSPSPIILIFTKWDVWMPLFGHTRHTSNYRALCRENTIHSPAAAPSEVHTDKDRIQPWGKQHFSVLAGGRVKDMPRQRLLRPPHPYLWAPLAGALFGTQGIYPRPSGCRQSLLFSAMLSQQLPFCPISTLLQGPGLFFWAALCIPSAISIFQKKKKWKGKKIYHRKS